ncbi:glycoside hydrolase family 13 protein [Fomitopsis serialis]|uniref:glycoside hydrolase family 13 protein n=1 Tax=Fomitopsis serialis TaxID=139415 RepID=UPI002007DD5C|nr:glycoside hydrolase family 13 protein [Neoantrodia serialis]KAH9917822.1 glycoside hydrolase family 13 protein [Neoantrodia serialis]
MGQNGSLIDWVLTRLRGYPRPALERMRLSHRSTPDNGLMIQFFTWDSKHPNMSWWQHFETEVPRLADLGVTQVWLPPPNKAMNETGQGYDAYDLWDLGEFDQKGVVSTRWGTKDQLVHAIEVAKAHGIDVLIDAILNHKIGADRTETFEAVPVDPQNRLRDLTPPREIEGWTAFDFPGRKNHYSTFKWTQEHFTGLDWDHKKRLKGVYRIVGGSHKGWSKFVDSELGNYDYLLGADIDHRHPDVRQDIFAWGEWVLKTTGGAGFRLDAIKHIDRYFLLDFLKHVRRATGREDVFAVAEYWSANVKLIKPYIYVFQGLVTFFDVPLHHNFYRASKAGARYDLRTIFNDTVVKFRPGDAITFVDNHECQIGQSLESWVGANFKIVAYALVLLRGEGHPCVFYGDLYPNEECYDARVANALQVFMKARKLYAYGDRTDYFHSRNCIGFVRSGDAQHGGCAVLVSNADQGHGAQGVIHSVRMNVGTNVGPSTFNSMIGTGSVDVSADGWGTFTCLPGAVQVWVKNDFAP